MKASYFFGTAYAALAGILEGIALFCAFCLDFSSGEQYIAAALLTLNALPLVLMSRDCFNE